MCGRLAVEELKNNLSFRHCGEGEAQRRVPARVSNLLHCDGDIVLVGDCFGRYAPSQ